MKALRIINTINNQLKEIDKLMLKKDADVISLYNRRTDLLHRKDIASKYLFQF